MEGQGNITVSALKARFDAPSSNKPEINSTRKVSDKNSKFKPHTATDKITNSTSTTKPTLKTLESKNASTLDWKNVSTIDRKSSVEQKSLSKQEESGKRLSNNKVESSCDTPPNSNSVINGGSSLESGSRLSTTNKINIPAAFSCETTTNTSPTTKPHHVRKSPYQTTRQISQQSNHENSTEPPNKNTNASPKHVVLDKGIAMRDPEEIKFLGGGLIKERTKLLTQAIQGNTGTKSKVAGPPTPERSDSLPKGFELDNKGGVILRKRDNKKFQLINKSKLQTPQKCPSKPRKLESAEMIFLLKQYQKAVEELSKSNGTSQPEEQRSLIPDMTEEEEEEVEDSTSSQCSSTTGYRPIPPPPRKPIVSSTGSDQTYDDIGNTPTLNECDDETYDDLNDFQENEKKREKERRDKEEKKRKEKEEKERKKQEKEEKKMRAKLKMDGTEQVVSEGTFTGEAFKPSKLDLVVKKGDRINILRMLNNPAGKWLAKSEDGRLGYVESQFVEICASNIRNVMGVGQSHQQSSECPPRYGWYSLCYGICFTPGDEDVTQDDIYEEIPKV